MSGSHVGSSQKKLNDGALLRGQGLFVDDVPLHAPLHVAFVRSSIARGRILSIDLSVALANPGVIAIYTASDIGELDAALPLLIPHPAIIAARTQRPLARDEVFYVGQAIAMIVAESRYIAEDAAMHVSVFYDVLPVEIDLLASAAAAAPRVHADIPGNLGAHLSQSTGDLQRAIARAQHVTHVVVSMERSSATPIETRAVAASFDARSGELNVWDTTQAPIPVRSGLAALLGIDEHKIRVIAPNVGGGFGQKLLFFYPDEVLVPFAAIRLGRPVKYVEDRHENFTTSSQERRQIHNVTLYAMNDGEVLGMHDSFLHDTGAFMPYGIIVPHVSAASIAGPYRIPNIEIECDVIYTPTVPVTPYRGCGRPHACFAMERALDQLADELDLDRIEVRRLNLVRDDEFPYRREGFVFQDGAPVELDSGQYHRALDMMGAAIDMPTFRQDQALALAHGRHLGFGLACYVEGAGIGPYEGARLRVHPVTGKILVASGVASQGQGHETVLAQIVADQMGVAPADVLFIAGDTREFDWGGGTYASRTAVVAGNAVHQAAVNLRTKTIAAAARMFDVQPEDIELRDGRAHVQHRGESASLAVVATAANPLRYAFNDAARIATQFAARRPASAGPALTASQHPGLEVHAFFSPARATWGYGVHAAVVEVDPLTGHISILRYLCLHDCGVVINPAIVTQQIIGGIAQGIAGAFYERIDFDAQGVIQNASFERFLMPFAADLPRIEVMHLETPSPLNPMGVKGVGEAGCIAVGATLAAAIDDALKPRGMRPIRQLPITPEAICMPLAHMNPTHRVSPNRQRKRSS